MLRAVEEACFVGDHVFIYIYIYIFIYIYIYTYTYMCVPMIMMITFFIFHSRQIVLQVCVVLQCGAVRCNVVQCGEGNGGRMLFWGSCFCVELFELYYRFTL